MGLNTSKASNYIESVLTSTIDIVAQQTQHCKTTNSNVMQMTFDNCEITGTTIDQSANVAVNMDCIKQGSFSATTSSQLTNNIGQYAEAMGQQFGLSNIDARNFVNQSVKMAQQISIVFQQIVESDAVAVQGVNCKGSKIKNSLLKQDYLSAMSLKGMSKDSAIVNAQQQLQNIISQSASAKQENFLDGLWKVLAAVAAILAVVMGVPIMGGASMIKTILASPWFWSIVAGAGAVGDFALYDNSIWPYKKPKADKRNTGILLASMLPLAGISLGTAGLGAYQLIKKPKAVSVNASVVA